jgi:helicase MOV-10
MRCHICDVVVSGRKCWDEHIRGTRHQAKANSAGVSPDIEPEQPETVRGQNHCTLCNTFVPIHFWDAHLRGAKHASRVQFAAYTSALDESEKDKNSVSIIGDFDFKFVSLDRAAAGVSAEGRIEVGDPGARIAVVEVALTSNKGITVTSP